MPLIFPYPFPGENQRDPVELMRFGRNTWGRLQKWRGGQFSWTQLITAGTLGRVTFTDPSVGGTDAGFDNTIAGMWVVVTPPATIPSGIQVDYSFVSAPGTLTMQVRNTTGGDLTVSGTWSYVGYTY